jgi:hypothetical protein
MKKENKRTRIVELIEKCFEKTPYVILDEEIGCWHKVATQRAKRLFGSHALTSSIKGSGICLEDIIQELWIYGLVYRLKSESTNPFEVQDYVYTAMDWKAHMLKRDMSAAKRGFDEVHVSGEEADYYFNGISLPGAENE